MPTYVCQSCGKQFESRRKPHDKHAPKFCSLYCARTPIRKYYPRPCIVCGKDFTPQKDYIKHCSSECQYVTHRNRGFINCAVCGKQFKRRRKAGRFCSLECYAASMLSAFPRKGKEFSKAVRRAIKERDRYACVDCGSTQKLEVDHITPVSLGGDNSIENGQTLCHKCHREKSLSQRKVILSRHKLL